MLTFDPKKFGDRSSNVMADGAPWRNQYSSDDPSETFEVFDPANGQLIARVAGADARGVEQALRNSKEAFKEWRNVGPVARGTLLRKAAAAVREHADEIAAIESREVGKPYEISRQYDLEVCINSFEFFAGQATALHGEYYPGGAIDTYTIPEPYGVVAGVVPFNWPPIHTGAKAAAALAAGNVVLLKPPEQCPFTVIALVEAISSVLPEGVLQVVPGLGRSAGAALASSPLVDRLSFTGSPETGRQVLKAAAENHTGTLMELGGKNPIVVFEDADIDLAVSNAVEATFFNNGEACTSGSRLLVHSSIADEFAEKYAEFAARLRMGDPLEMSTQLGPMVTDMHCERVKSYIEIGINEGAKLIYRGEAPTDAAFSDGYWVAPVVFDHVKPGMRIEQEEIFGPVASIIRFDTVEEAIEIANGTDFALVAGIFSRNESLARKVAGEIDAGVVFINNFSRRFLPTPFGGNRASGFGREHTAATMHEYLRTKSVRLPSNREAIPRWSAAV